MAAVGMRRATSPSLGGSLRDSSSSVELRASYQCFVSEDRLPLLSDGVEGEDASGLGALYGLDGSCRVRVMYAEAEVGSSLRFQNGCEVPDDSVYTGASLCCDNLRQNTFDSETDAFHPLATLHRLLRSSVVQGWGIAGGG